MALTYREWAKIPIGPDGLSEAEARHFIRIARRHSKRLNLGEWGILKRTHGGLKTGQVVGVMVGRGRALEILPKIDGEDGEVRSALVHMLAVTWNLKVAGGETAAMDTQRLDFLEILIRLFARRLLAAVRRGLPRRYVSREDDIPVLRGRLNVTRQFTQLAAVQDRLACRFDELSEDTPLNRVLKAAVVGLLRLTRSAENSRRLSDLAARFDHVTDVSDPLREPVQLDRTNTAFHDLLALARVFLSGDWQSTASGRSHGFGLLFAMNDLFEAFVGKCLSRAAAPRSVSLQDRGSYLLSNPYAGTRLFAVRPDAVVDKHRNPVVFDTKWKWLWRDDGGGNDTLGVSSADVYQMLAYARVYGAQRLVLVYPWHRALRQPEGVGREWVFPGSDGRLEIATLDISQPCRAVVSLRKILQHSPDLGRGAAVD